MPFTSEKSKSNFFLQRRVLNVKFSDEDNMRYFEMSSFSELEGLKGKNVSVGGEVGMEMGKK